MAPSPRDASDGPIGVSIKCNGQQISDQIEIETVHVRHDMNDFSIASVGVSDDFVMTCEDPLLDAPCFAIGNSIEIAAFWGSGPEQMLFKGIITSSRLRSENGGIRLILHCQDAAQRTLSTPRTARFTDVTDADAMAQILKTAGLEADISTGGEVRNVVLQDKTTDWNFLRQLASRNGHVIHVFDGKVTCAPANLDASALLSVTLGVDILTLDCALGCADSDTEKHGMVTYSGTAGASTGQIIELVGVGEKLGGNVYLWGVEHSIASGDWTTTAHLGGPAAHPVSI